MNQELFEAMIHTLDVDTLARLVVDLEEAQAEWADEPERAPASPVQAGLKQVLNNLVNLGTTLAESEGIEFQELVEQVREREMEEWPMTRARQEQQNWYSDFG